MPVTKFYPFIILFASVFSAGISYSQNQEQPVYSLFDKTFGAKNSGLNNGTIHVNPYRSSNGSYRYFQTNDYIRGSIIYDGQPYSGILMKYDLLDDGVVIKLDEENDIGVNVIRQKTASFYIDGKKFTNLDFKALKRNFDSGFYEETTIGTDMILYTRHSKNRVELLIDKTLFHNFTDKSEFLLYTGTAWYKITSRSSVAEAFPEYESKIEEFYAANADLAKSDKKLFFEKLLLSINTFLNQKQNH